MNKGLVNMIYNDILLGRRVNIRRDIISKMFTKHSPGEDRDLDVKVDEIKKYFNLEVH